MNFIKILGGILLLSITSLEAQEKRSYSKLHEWKVDYQEKLPEWVFDCVDSIFLGVSDPYLKPEVAKEQAIQRALFLYSLWEGVNIGVLQDYFLVTETNHGYDELDSKLMIFISMNFNCEKIIYDVLQEHYSQYGEAYVTVSVKKDTVAKGDLSGSGEFMCIVKENARLETERKTQLSLNASMFEIINNTCFSCKGNKETFRIDSQINEESLYFPKDCYYYSATCTKQEGQIEGKSLKNTFWNAQVESLFDSVVNGMFDNVFLKATSELYHSQLKELKRETVRDRVRIRMDKCYIFNNHLYTNWNLVNHGSVN